MVNLSLNVRSAGDRSACCRTLIVAVEPVATACHWRQICRSISLCLLLTCSAFALLAVLCSPGGGSALKPSSHINLFLHMWQIHSGRWPPPGRGNRTTVSCTRRVQQRTNMQHARQLAQGRDPTRDVTQSVCTASARRQAHGLPLCMHSICHATSSWLAIIGQRPSVVLPFSALGFGRRVVVQVSRLRMAFLPVSKRCLYAV